QATKAGRKDGYISVFPVDIANNLSLFMNRLKSSFFSMEFFKDNDGRLYRIINGEKIYYKDQAEVDNAVNAVRKLLNQIKGVSLVKENHSNMNLSFEIKFDVSGIRKLDDHLFSMP
ncbi:hypothetical protein ACNART_17955, partial [Proteus sp. LHD240705]|uniref:hypothetical protein n=1 Tax=Proteus sp. LHD240705 TaxID=3400183 RepID=UPI003A4D1EC4